MTALRYSVAPERSLRIPFPTLRRNTPIPKHRIFHSMGGGILYLKLTRFALKNRHTAHVLALNYGISSKVSHVGDSPAKTAVPL